MPYHSWTRSFRRQRWTEPRPARIKYVMGLEMEKRDQRDLAHDLYRAASELSPADAEISKRLASVAATFASGSKYDYLLREKMVTTDQLQKAFGLSKKTNKSVEYVLIETFKIKKEADRQIAFPFSTAASSAPFDPAVPTPFELLSNLKKAFLLNELWVPLSWSKEGIEVLVDDPRNLNKTDNIKALMKTPKINVTVAIREDIQAFINHFFDKDRATEAQAPQEEATDDIDIPDITFEEEREELSVEEADESSSQVVKLVDQVIIAAYRKNASDIHIEPSVVTKATTIRFRLDGVCQEYMKIPNGMVRGGCVAHQDHVQPRHRRAPPAPGRQNQVSPQGGPALRDAGGHPADGRRVRGRGAADSGFLRGHEGRRDGAHRTQYRVIKKIVLKPYGLILAVGPDRLRQNNDAARPAGPHQQAGGQDMDGRRPHRNHPAGAAPGGGQAQDRA